MQMPVSIEELKRKVASQREAIPALYGDVDFSIKPERFVDDLKIDAGSDDPFRARLAAILAETDKVEMVRAYTMLGDTVADAYAALMPTYGFRGLISMLTLACDEGIDAVADAPPELVAFIAAMEQTPDWLDMKLVEEGARLERNGTANYAPVAIRGAFIATFMNKYAALPMALTGTLSNETSAKRVKETASFFATSVLPGALERYGAGFRAAAMVRLMHSMVRFNALRRSGTWDVSTFGIPIPQVDQMPAGLIPIFLMSFKILAAGRTEFTPAERARVELARYRCYLLGLPEDLLADTPQGVVDIMLVRDQTLRKGFDDATCGVLLRATLEAYLPNGESPGERLYNWFEKGFSKVFFVLAFLGGDRTKAAEMGVRLTVADYACFAACSVVVQLRMQAYDLAAKIPGLREAADRRLIAKIRRLLDGYGHAEFTTDAAKYRPAVVAKAA